MDLEAVMRRRKMVRHFEDRPLPASVVDRLVDSAQRGPSAGFTQGFELLVLEGQAETGRYWDASLPQERRSSFRWAGLLTAPLLIVPFAHERAYRDRYAEPDKARRAFSAPGFSSPWWIVDTAFASMLVLLTAVDAGLGALFFSVFQPDAVRAAFGVPDEFTAIGAIAVGYPASDEPSSSVARGRRPAAEVVHRGGW